MVEKLKRYAKQKFSNGPKAKILFGLVIITGLLITIYSMKKTVTVSIDGKEQTITTFKGTVEGALKGNNIAFAPKDKIQPALKENLTNNGKIQIKTAVPVEILVDDKILKIDTAEENVKDLLAVEGVAVNEHDKISPSIEDKVVQDMKVDIVRVKSETIKQSEPIDFNTVVKDDDTLDNSVNKTVQEGIPGEKEITYELVYENGKEVSKKAIDEKVVKQPTEKIVVKGTLNTLALSRGEKVVYKKKIPVVATAYSGHTITATGNVPKRNPGGISTIAVDPKLIPLGTKVYVEGYGYAIAHDTGGVIKNNKIDLFMNSSSETYSWGVRNVNMYVISYPGE